jgi:hypothetical protein
VLIAVDTALLRSLVEMASRPESGNLPHLQELRIWSKWNEMPEGFDEVLKLTPALRVLETPIPSPRDTYTLSLEFIDARVAGYGNQTTNTTTLALH